MYNYVHMLIMLSLVLVCFVLCELKVLMSFSLINYMSENMEFMIYLEMDSMAFLLTVIYIFTSVMVYTFSYMKCEVFLKRFMMILSLFVCSMLLLILSGNLFTSIIGWDGLGVTSLFLILFYYSKSSMKASLLTFLMNRVGDCFFILMLTSILILGENQMYYTLSPEAGSFSMLLVLTSITKSAQIPFSTWLPAAMEAPTPVSALVHSSTLVTAGIFLLYRYKHMWLGFNSLLMILSISTCFMAALSALVENDLKKLIALSTLSQLGFVMFSFSLGQLPQGFFHMLMHAYFKALLFMCAGYLIHSFGGVQSISLMSLSQAQSPLLMMIMVVSLISMMGLPYMSGFYSKDMIIDTLKSTEWSLLIYFLLVVSFICTSMYSIRMVWYLMTGASNWNSMCDEDVVMLKPMIIMASLASVGGGGLSWLMSEPEASVNSSKLLILVLIVVSTICYWCVDTVLTSDFLEKKWNLSNFNPLIYNLVFETTKSYTNSSDLQGVPEHLNKWLSKLLSALGKGTNQLEVLYMKNLELILFVSMMTVFMI